MWRFIETLSSQPNKEKTKNRNMDTEEAKHTPMWSSIQTKPNKSQQTTKKETKNIYKTLSALFQYAHTTVFVLSVFLSSLLSLSQIPDLSLSVSMASVTGTSISMASFKASLVMNLDRRFFCFCFFYILFSLLLSDLWMNILIVDRSFPFFNHRLLWFCLLVQIVILLAS